MKHGLEITDSELIFTAFPSNEIGFARYCKSFNLKLIEIKLIGISPRLVIDDETIFILLIDKTGKVYPMPAQVIGSNGFDNFEDYFKLNPIQEQWVKFEYDDDYGKIDKVVYPKEKYWSDLFEKDWKLRIRALYSWIQPKSFYGNLNKKTFEFSANNS